jgi:hypothetical protein
MDTASPHVFVPPADTKERKMSMVVANGRRASAFVAQPTAASTSIPILNEPGMQPLLPLLPPQAEDKASSPVMMTSTITDEKGDTEVKEEKKQSSPLTVVTKPTLPLVSELSDRDLEKCSDLIFFIREHPEIFLDIATCCNSLSVRMIFCCPVCLLSLINSIGTN